MVLNIIWNVVFISKISSACNDLQLWIVVFSQVQDEPFIPTQWDPLYITPLQIQKEDEEEKVIACAYYLYFIVIIFYLYLVLIFII